MQFTVNHLTGVRYFTIQFTGNFSAGTSCTVNLRIIVKSQCNACFLFDQINKKIGFGGEWNSYLHIHSLARYHCATGTLVDIYVTLMSIHIYYIHDRKHLLKKVVHVITGLAKGGHKAYSYDKKHMICT